MRHEIHLDERLSSDQEKWLEAMHFCDDMQAEAEEAQDLVLADWWHSQAELCMSRVHKNAPYLELE